MPLTRRHFLVTGAALVGLAHESRAEEPTYTAFTSPEDVILSGYDGDAMEPFLTRDGNRLLFNNRNEPADKTDIFIADRIDDTHFAFRGALTGANAAGTLDGVASLSRDNELFFVSTRSYGSSFSTLYRARFDGPQVSPPELVPGVSRLVPGYVNFDAEISADGNTLYYVDSWFGPKGFPQSAAFKVARRDATGFTPDPDSDRLLKNVNGSGLQYAAGISADECELFFTRVAAITVDAMPAIWRAARPSTSEPFGEPERIAAITGFAEAPTLSPDGRSLYFHQRVDGKFQIRRVTRRLAPAAGRGPG